MDNPPHINVAICEAFMVAWIKGHVFGHHEGQVGSCGAADRVWVETTVRWLKHLHLWFCPTESTVHKLLKVKNAQDREYYNIIRNSTDIIELQQY